VVLTEIIGWAGTLVLLAAYALTTTGRISGQSLAYQLLNIAGAAAVAVNVIAHRAWPAALLEVGWAVIGVVTLVRMALARR